MIRSFWKIVGVIPHSRWTSMPRFSSALAQEQELPVKEPMRFDAMTVIPKPLKRALQSTFKYETMSEVQEKVLELLPSDKDLLVKAKTGTGKTLAFLIAALSQTMQERFNHKDLHVVVMAPTRELATQIHAEAYKLLSFCGLRSQVVVGGQSKHIQLTKLTKNPCNILIATPGRLLDLIDSDPIVGEKLATTKVFVLDEVDRLTDQGFLKDIQSISSRMPKERQNLFFSATFDEQTKEAIRTTMQPDHTFIDCVPKDEIDTHLQIKQTLLQVPLGNQLSFLYQTVKKHVDANPNAKVMVFLPTASQVIYAAQVFNRIEGIQVLELHSKLAQNSRDRTSFRFRSAASAVLFTTDLSARGVDYPNVSLVIQMGVPSSREQYIHRIGRTGRAGKNGEALLVLAPFENRFRNELSNLPVLMPPQFPKIESHYEEVVTKAVESISASERRHVFVSWLTYYRHNLARLGLTKESWLAAAETFAVNNLRLPEMPPLSASMIRDFGLSKVYGIGLDNRAPPLPKRQPFKFSFKGSKRSSS